MRRTPARKHPADRRDRQRKALLSARKLVDDMRSRYRELERLTGASIPMHRALAGIAESPGISASHLATMLGMKRPAVSHVLKGLGGKGLDRTGQNRSRPTRCAAIPFPGGETDRGRHRRPRCRHSATGHRPPVGRRSGSAIHGPRRGVAGAAGIASPRCVARKSLALTVGYLVHPSAGFAGRKQSLFFLCALFRR